MMDKIKRSLIMINKDELLGLNYLNETISFLPSDTEENFKINLEKQSQDWYYRNKSIEYNFNAHGHRCNDLSLLNFENYILFLGDSNTFGMGVELEKTYAHIVAETLGMSYYNLGIPASGIDAMFYNLNIWLTKFPKPKYIVILWSDIARCLVSHININTRNKLRQLKHLNEFSASGPWDTEDAKKNLMVYGDLSGHFNARFIIISNMIKIMLEFHNITFSNISITEQPNIRRDILTVKSFHDITLDKARDARHPGIKSHKEISDYLINTYYASI